jgi:hypothetical protein
VHALVLERADDLEARAVADVREARVRVAAEGALADPAVLRAVEDGAPHLQLADAVGRLLRVVERHAVVRHVLGAAHRVAEVDLPVVARVHVAERGGDAALGHDRVGLAEEGLADEAGLLPLRRGFDRGAQARAAGADDDHVVLVDDVGFLGHQKNLTSWIAPVERRRT